MRPVCREAACVPPLADLAAVLFDMDGTLVNSNAVVERTWSDWAAGNGLDVAAVLADCHGAPAASTVRRWRPDLDETQVADEVTRLTDRECTDLDGVVPCVGAAEAVRAVVESGTPWAVVTSAPLRLALARLRATGIGDPPVLVPVEDITRGKPDPEGFLVGAQRCGVPIERCLVVEDSGPGLQAGRDSGAHVLAVGPQGASLADVARHWA